MPAFVPLSKGGSNSIDNMVPCCKKCNASKHTMSSEKWMSKIISKYPHLSNSEAENENV